MNAKQKRKTDNFDSLVEYIRWIVDHGDYSVKEIIDWIDFMVKNAPEEKLDSAPKGVHRHRKVPPEVSIE